MKTTSLLALVPGLFYPITPSEFGPGPIEATLDGKSYVLYKGSSGQTVAHTDVCPHLGASLSKGRLDENQRITCHYHGFCFSNEGRFCGILKTGSKKGGKQVIQPLPTYSDNLCTYIAPDGIALFAPYQVPEAYDKSYTAIHGYRDINARQSLVTENILDMTHISVVHSFGNPQLPLPRSVKFEKLSQWSGRSTFEYSPRPGSLSTIIAASPKVDVMVENEYHLPTTTVTRVRVGDSVKTVLTRAQPIGTTKTRLHYTIYRNFYQGLLGDIVLRAMMDLTLNEDVAVLKTIHSSDQLPKNPLTLMYDVTFLEYRKALAEAERRD
jgi:phenylpropionate dioxygenase-like ring-hydroxylating dioxygenase large terminal subunit